MIIKCRKCGKEFDTASRRNQHEKDAHGYKAGKSPFKPAHQQEGEMNAKTCLNEKRAVIGSMRQL